MPAKIIMIVPVPSVTSSTRATKLARSFAEKSKVEFWGWRRSFRRGEAPPTLDNVEQKAILAGGGFSGRFTRFFYPLWTATIFLRLALRRRSSVYAYGLEAALPSVLAATLRGHQVIFDDPDKTSFVIERPAWLVSLLRRLEDFTAARARLHLIPGRSRYSNDKPNMFILPNVPSDLDLKAANAFNAIRPDGQLVIYVNGWIGEGRGAAMLRSTAEHFKDDHRLKFLCAGRTTGDDANAFAGMANVEWRARIPQAEALALYRAADLACTFYDPSRLINRFAEPNKWWDCIFTGTPPIINKGIFTSKFLSDNGACLTVDYDQSGAGLIALVERLLRDPSPIARAREALSRLRSTAHSQEHYLQVLTERI